MKLQVSVTNGLFTEEQMDVIYEFIKFLQKQVPLENINIKFIDRKNGKMTTGVSMKNSYIKVLAGNRMLIDVLRTLAHEWIHEGQKQILGWGEGKNIGGPHENQANSLAGVFLKQFQEKHPNSEEILYE